MMIGRRVPRPYRWPEPTVVGMAVKQPQVAGCVNSSPVTSAHNLIKHDVHCVGDSEHRGLSVSLLLVWTVGQNASS